MHSALHITNFCFGMKGVGLPFKDLKRQHPVAAFRSFQIDSFSEEEEEEDHGGGGGGTLATLYARFLQPIQ